MAQVRKLPGSQNRQPMPASQGFDVQGAFDKALKSIQSSVNSGGRPRGSGGPNAIATTPYTPKAITTPDKFNNPLTNWNPKTVDPEAAIRALEPVYKNRIKEGMAEAGAQAGFTGMSISTRYMQQLGEEEAQGINEWQMAHEGLAYDASKFNREQELQKMLAQANLDFQSWSKSGDWSMQGQMFTESQRFAGYEGAANRSVDIYGIDTSAETQRQANILGTAGSLAGTAANTRMNEIGLALDYGRQHGASPGESWDAIAGMATGGNVPGPYYPSPSPGPSPSPSPSPRPNPNPTPRPPGPFPPRTPPGPFPPPYPRPFPSIGGSAMGGVQSLAGRNPGSTVTPGSRAATPRNSGTSKSSRYPAGRNPNFDLIQQIMRGY